MNPQGDDPTLDAMHAMLAEIVAMREEMQQASTAPARPHPFIEWGLGIIGTLLVAAILGMVSITAQIRSIQDTRFTREDGERLRREMQILIQPSPDVLRRLTDHERRLERVEDERGR